MSTETLNILAIAGSLRAGSVNRGLLRAAAAAAPGDVRITIYETIGDLPFYNGDEDHGVDQHPAPVRRLRDAIAAADALLIATPEYNYSVPGVLKNAIDWVSRAPSPLANKPLAMLGAGGMSGTARAQLHLRQILVHNNALVLNKPEVYVARAWEKFDRAGELADEPTREQVGQLVVALAAWARRMRSSA